MKKALLLTLFFVLLVTFGFSQTDKYWSANSDVRSSIITDKGVARLSFPKEFKLFNLNTESLRKELFSIVGSSAKSQTTVISLPNADGGFEQFEVNESSNFEPSLQARFPEIRAYSGRGITDRAASLKLSISPQGIQTMVFRAGKANEFIEAYSKDHSVYAVFRSQREKGQLKWTCSTPEENLAKSLNAKVASSGLTGSSAGELKTMRLAQSCNGEYSNFFGATSAAQVGLVLAAFNATLTRCNGTYEKDLAIHLNLVPESENVIYYNPATDPYTTLANWNTQLQIALNTTLTGVGTPIGVNNAAYDIGHMFGASGGGGNAGCIGCVCVDGTASGTGATKGRGITSPADGIPMGDNFDIDYVAHEVGHQMGGNHTFSMSNEGLGQNKEVGSGITIMGYAGITSQDVAPHSIDIWHETSIGQIQANMATKTCPVTTNITANNATPVVSPQGPYIIPISTPFALTGVATDANASDVLTYCWEQDQDGVGQTGNNSVAYIAKPTGPNWLSFPATVSPTRLFPRLSTILAGLNVTPVLPGGDAVANIEALSSVARVLNFRLTVRDNASYVADPPASRKVGQTAFTDVIVTVSATAGPFQVTQPNTNVSWAGGSSQTVTWDVNNTTVAPVSCANVRILLSTDGGNTFPTVLLASTPNDGTQAVTIPNGPSTTARIKVEAVGNIFFDISNTNFTITGATVAPEVTINQAAAQADPTSVSPINFTVVFDQPVTGFATGDVTLSGTAGATTATVSGGPTTYNVAVSGMASSGTVIATIPAGVCQNASAQTNNASTSTDNTVTYNLPATPPTVTINQAAAQADPTGTSPINFTVVFDQPVTGFATGDVTLSGTAGATTGAVTGSGATYNVAVSGMTGSGTVIATVPAGVAQNASAQPNSASTSTDNTVTYNAPPGCTSVNPVPNQTVCNNSPTAAVNFTSPTPGTTFSWVNNNTSIGLAASGNGNIPSFTATNPGATPNVGTITVTPTLTTVTPTTTTFNFTGGAQTFTVPAGVTSINLTTLGAQGGTGATGGDGATGGVGGLGSRATGTLAVTPGQVLTIFVGGTGGAPTAGFNGGGTGGNANSGGGGGASDVRFPGASSADRILVAGGGGGGGRAGCEPNTVNGGAGGNGDGNGVDGATSPNGGGGFGAIGVVPGLQGIGCAGFLGSPGLAGFGPAGGNGGAGQSCCCFNFASVPGGGGGGGGFLGGAGGGGGSAGTVLCSGNDKGGGGGGAGGTSYTGGVTAGAVTTAIQTGNGQVVLNYNVTTVCTGPTTIFTITVLPTATVNAIPNQTLCAGSPTTPVNFTSATPGAIFNWTNNTPAIGLAASGTGNIPSFIAQNPGATPLTATITVTPSVPIGGGPCAGSAPQTFTNNTPVVIADVAVTTSTLVVAGAPAYLLDLNMITSIIHSFASDMDITITSPAGTVVTLTSDNGGGNDNVYNGTTWDDDANPGGQVPYTANNGLATDHTYANLTTATPLVPEEPFGAFIGENPNGTWTLRVSDDLGGDAGSINSWSLVISGLAAAPTVANTSVTNSTPVTIPTGPAVVTSTMNVVGAGTQLLDVNLTSFIIHTFASDLDITIQSPAGTVVTLTTDNGAGNDNVFNGTIWDDDANPAGQVPYTANNGMVTDHTYANLTTASPLTPEEALAAFVGENPNGTWTLTVSDDLGGDGGTINSWTLNLQTSICSGFCVGTPRSFTITVNPNPAIVIIADPGTTICEGDPTLLTVVTGTASPLGVLYTQGNAPVNGSPSQVFEPANAAFNSQSADDFVVPVGSNWSITQMTANGIGAGVPTSVNVFFYNNSGTNLPGTAVATYNNLTTFTQAGGNYTVTLPAALNLSAGRYWVSFQVNMSFATGGQWFWGNFGAPTLGFEYAFQNPGGGFATPCTSWGYAGTGCNVGGGAANVNSIFSLTGTSVTGGGPLGPGYTFLWTPALGLSSTTSNPVAASPMNTTTYTVTATTPGGCTRQASVLITVNKRPVVTTQPANNVRCVGTTATFTVGATGTGLIYQWQESLNGCAGPWVNLANAAPYNGVNTATLTISPVTQIMTGRAYRVIVTGACAPWTPPTNVSNCATLTVNPNPVVAITPPISCGGVAGISGTQLSVGSAPPPVPGNASANSGVINVPIPDGSGAAATSNLTIAGVPANATITEIKVNINIGHSWVGDVDVNLRAPNNAIMNLVGGLDGGTGGNTTDNFANTAFSSLGGSTISGAAAPRTGTFTAEARAGFGPTGFIQTVNTWTGLVPTATPTAANGQWTLAAGDFVAIDAGSITNWSISIDYTTPGVGTANNSYVWSPLAGLYNNSTATVPYLGTNTPTVYAAPTVFTVYTVTATDNVTGCFSTAQAFVNYTPPAPTVTPNPVAMCLGDPAVRLIASSATTTTTQFCSGPISVIVPDGSTAGATSNITVSGIPAACNVSGLAVTYNLNHTWAGDIAVALRAPNGNILNLDYYLSNTGFGPTTGFVNTRISSTGTAAIGASPSPYTGTFRADAFTAPTAPVNGPTGPVGFLANVNNWNALYSTPNGVWTLAMVDPFNLDQGTLTSWCIDVTYVCGVPSTPATWSPIGGLFNDAAATIPYAGTPRDTVWTRPTPSGVYTYQVTVQSLPPAPMTFTSTTPIAIPTTAGPANPYPSNLVVSGLPPSGVTVRNVTITGINHSWSGDVDIALQSPNGTQTVILLSDIGEGGTDFLNNTYVFQDGAPAMAGTPPASGTYRPTNLVGTIGIEPDNFPAPGPGPLAQPNPTLSTFTGNMNGTWRLLVVDDAALDGGSVAGFSIGFDLGIAPCTSPARTVTVTVNQPTTITTQPVAQTICTDKVATFTVVAAGTGPFAYQWQVSTTGIGGPYTNITNGGVYSGATTATLTITAPPVSMNGYYYRVVINGAAPCAAATSTPGVLLTVNPLPVVVISAAPFTTLLPGLQTTLSSTVTPNAAATYTWLRNGVVLTNPALGVVSGIGTGSLVLNVDGMGDYQLRVTDVNGCTNSSNIITIRDSASGKCFIYPNPTSGIFQVRYYSVANNVLPRSLTIYDSKGDRVYTKFYTIGRPYDRMDVDMRAYGKGLYWVEIGDLNGNRLTMCRVVIQ